MHIQILLNINIISLNKNFKEQTCGFKFQNVFFFSFLNRYEISIRLKISLRCLVSYLPVLRRNENSRRYGFYIGHFNRHEVSNWYAIFTWTEFTGSEMDHWILRLMCMCVWMSLRIWISKLSFWQKWNFISGNKISRKH